MGPTAHPTSARDGYEIRWFEPGDEDDFLSLYSTAYGDVDEIWFEWKYEALPYADRVPIVVADRDGTVVGVRPTVVVPLRAGDETILALQQVDLLVHPDHRRRGLFTRMVEWLYDRCAAGSSTATFMFANGPSRRGYEKMDERYATSHSSLGTFTRFERVQTPSAFASDASTPTRLATWLGSPVARAYLAARDRRARRATEIPVERRESLPIGLLTRLYRRAMPDLVHVRRDETFYRWRFASPDRRYRTYVAGGADPVAAAVVCERDGGGARTVQIDEVLPLGGGGSRAAASALLGRIVKDSAAADRITVAGDAFTTDVLLEHGFLPSTAFPLDRVIDPTYVLARPLGDLSTDHPRLGAWLSDRDRWRGSYCVRDLG
jgi:GNAT superfamily N-acetyltransferase